MDEVEFLFHCIRDGKLSKEQAETILNKKSSSSCASSSASLQVATFLPGDSKVAAGTLVLLLSMHFLLEFHRLCHIDLIYLI